jgi:hypothetical protein
LWYLERCVLVVFMNLGDRISLTLDNLHRAVAARIAGGAMQAAMILLVCQRVRRTDRLIRALLARFLAGRLRVVAVSRRGVGAGRTRVISPRLPRGFGWLLPMVPYQAAGFASQFRVSLAEPEMVALIAATPQARRVLGPLCRMLGIEASMLRPAVECGAELVVPEHGVAGERSEPAPGGNKRSRVARAKVDRPPVDVSRIPLPRGVLTAARRLGFGRR